MEILPLNSSLEIKEEKCMIGINSSEVFNSVSNITEDNKRFENYTPGLWDGPETIEKRKVLLEQINSNQTKLHP